MSVYILNGRSFAGVLSMSRNPVLAAAVVVAGWLAGAATPSRAQDGPAAVTCTNPLSGASWHILIDYGKGTVDTYHAKISGAEISWFDPKDGGNYTLDRGSGDLTASVASSTGGYFRRSRCSLEKGR